MTLRELVYDVKGRLADYTDDTLFSDRHIAFLFNIYRARFLRQLYSDRAKQYDASAVQQLCLSMETVDRGLCGITINCTVRRSIKKLPNLLSLKGRSALVSAGPAVIGSKKFDIITEDAASECMADQYATNSVFISDGYVYAVGTSPAMKLLSCVRIQGIFDDPTALKDAYDCCECEATTADACFTEDATEYPAPAHMLPDISKAIVTDFMQTLKAATVRDTDNDSTPQQQ